jgi:cytochrome c553
MRLSRSFFLAIFITLTACTNVEQSKDVYKSDSTGTELALQVCSACHGRTGQAVSDQFPKLAGQHKEYLLIQLREFAEHRRSSPNAVAFMWSFNQLTTAQMNELAQYYSIQAPMEGEPSNSPLLVRGKNIYEQGIPGSNVAACSSCHGSNGVGGKEIPRLAGQHTNYIAEQINLFKSSTKRPSGVAMMSLTHSMSEDEIQAVSIYLGSLHVGSK